MPFDKLEAPSKAEGLRVDAERRFLRDLKIGVWRRRPYQSTLILQYFLNNSFSNDAGAI